GTCEACHKFISDGIGNVDENNGHRRCCVLRCQNIETVDCNKNVDLKRDELRGKADETFWNFRRKAMLQYNILPIDIAEIRQSLSERRKINGFFLGATGVPQHSNSRDRFDELCACGKGPCARRTCNQLYEITPPHSCPPVDGIVLA